MVPSSDTWDTSIRSLHLPLNLSNLVSTLNVECLSNIFNIAAEYLILVLNYARNVFFSATLIVVFLVLVWSVIVLFSTFLYLLERSWLFTYSEESMEWSTTEIRKCPYKKIVNKEGGLPSKHGYQAVLRWWKTSRANCMVTGITTPRLRVFLILMGMTIARPGEVGRGWVVRFWVSWRVRLTLDGWEGVEKAAWGS